MMHTRGFGRAPERDPDEGLAGFDDDALDAPENVAIGGQKERLVDAEFFNAFVDDFDEEDMNLP